MRQCSAAQFRNGDTDCPVFPALRCDIRNLLQPALRGRCAFQTQGNNGRYDTARTGILWQPAEERFIWELALTNFIGKDSPTAFKNRNSLQTATWASRLADALFGVTGDKYTVAATSSS